MENTYPNRCEEVLAHHGVKDMYWGIRRYQNPDGTLTSLGRKRYAKSIRQRLNENEKLYIKERHRYQTAVSKSNKLADKIEKRMGKGKTFVASKKEMQKGKKYVNTIKDSKKNLKTIEANTWKMMAEVAEAGLNVSVTNKQKFVAGKEVVAEMLLTGPILTSTIESIKSTTDKNYPNIVNYNKYKVY